jgi:hypothetical protein
MPNPRVNLTGEPYVTDGLRLVLFLNEPRFNSIDPNADSIMVAFPTGTFLDAA